jgi:hypothetical protein
MRLLRQLVPDRGDGVGFDCASGGFDVDVEQLDRGAVGVVPILRDDEVAAVVKSEHHELDVGRTRYLSSSRCPWSFGRARRQDQPGDGETRDDLPQRHPSRVNGVLS